MKTMRNETKHIMRAVTILATIFAMMFVLAGSSSAVVIGPLGNPTVIQAPIGTAVSPLGVRPAIFRSSVDPFFRPAFNPLFRPAFNPFFRPAFTPFFRPFFNPFFDVDVDVDGFGFGLGVGEVD